MWELKLELFNAVLPLTFATDADGDIDSLSVQLEGMVEATVFVRQPDAALSEPARLAPLAGTFAIGPIVLTVEHAGGDSLAALLMGERYELIAHRANRFKVKDQPSLSVEFVVDGERCNESSSIRSVSSNHRRPVRERACERTNVSRLARRQPGHTDELVRTTQEGAPVSAKESELQEKVRDVASTLEVPGVAVGVYHDGEEHYAFHGVTSIENPLPVDEHTLFQFGSTGKTFTATAIMRLVEQGKVDLDAPVAHLRPRAEAQGRDRSPRRSRSCSCSTTPRGGRATS